MSIILAASGYATTQTSSTSSTHSQTLSASKPYSSWNRHAGQYYAGLLQSGEYVIPAKAGIQ